MMTASKCDSCQLDAAVRFNHQSNRLGALAEIKDTANNNVRNAIKSRFDNLLESAKQRREFEIETDAQILF